MSASQSKPRPMPH